MRIIDLCRVVEVQGVDPFEVDVKRSLVTLRKYLPSLKLVDELLLDAEALSRLTSIIRLQRDWVVYRASSLYIDPLAVELKIRLSSPECLSQALTKSWHPIVSLDQIPSRRLMDAFDYWNALAPLSERFAQNAQTLILEPREVDLEDLVKLNIVTKDEFQILLQRLLDELGTRVDPDGRVRYEDFVYVEDFEETVLRAYLTSFLVSEGAAYLHIDPIEDEVYLIPGRLGESASTGPGNSKVVAIDYAAWKSHIQGRRGGSGGG